MLAVHRCRLSHFAGADVGATTNLRCWRSVQTRCIWLLSPMAAEQYHKYELWDSLLTADPKQDIERVRSKRQKLLSLPRNSELGKLLADIVARHLYRRDNLRHWVYSSISLESVRTRGLVLLCGAEFPCDVSVTVAQFLDVGAIGVLRRSTKALRAATYERRLMLATGEKCASRVSVGSKAIQGLTMLPKPAASIVLRSCTEQGRRVQGKDVVKAVEQSFGLWQKFVACVDARTQAAVLRFLDGEDLCEKNHLRYLQRPRSVFV